MFILWVINRIVKFRWWLMFFSSLRIECVVVGFSVLVVLLYSNILGLLVNVWVIVICCFCLLERFDG